VELVTFVGWNEETVNQLEWVTASEVNNELFVVERSTDGINFVEIGTRPGNGTTSESHTYNLTDYTPVEGYNYYRLKQIDFDGSYEYSPTIVIEVKSSTLESVIAMLYPNPAKEIINIQLQASHRTEFDLTVIDLTGRVVHYDVISAEKGLNVPFILDIQHYGQGVYIVNLTDRLTGEKLDAKFVKQ
jgi:hypothetical protein